MQKSRATVDACGHGRTGRNEFLPRVSTAWSAREAIDGRCPRALSSSCALPGPPARGDAMPTPRRSLVIVAILVATLFLSGCMRVDRTLHLNADGSGYYTLSLGFREPTAGDPSSVSDTITTPLEAFAARVRATGGSVSQAEDQGYRTWSFTRPFASASEADALVQDDPRRDDPKQTPVLFHDVLHVAQESRLSSSVFRVTGTISLVDVLDNAQSWSDARETLSVTMAGGIISSSGGTRRGDTVTYAVYYNQAATVDVVGRVAGSSDFFITQASRLVVGLLLVVSAVFAWAGIRLLLGRPAARKRDPRQKSSGLHWPLPRSSR